MTHHPGPDAKPEALQPPVAFARFGLLDFGAQLEQHFGNVDLDRADLRARATQAGGERQSGFVHDAEKLRRDNGADGAGIDPRERVTADLAVHRADVQASAAADTVERLPLFA